MTDAFRRTQPRPTNGTNRELWRQKTPRKKEVRQQCCSIVPRASQPLQTAGTGSRPSGAQHSRPDTRVFLPGRCLPARSPRKRACRLVLLSARTTAHHPAGHESRRRSKCAQRRRRHQCTKFPCHSGKSRYQRSVCQKGGKITRVQAPACALGKQGRNYHWPQTPRMPAGRQPSRKAHQAEGSAIRET